MTKILAFGPEHDNGNNLFLFIEATDDPFFELEIRRNGEIIDGPCNCEGVYTVNSRTGDKVFHFYKFITATIPGLYEASVIYKDGICTESFTVK